MKDEFGKLQSITVKGFKSIRALEAMRLQDINVVIGPNGAGKSNFVGLFKFLSRLAREETQLYVAQQGGLDKVLHFGPKVTNVFEIEIVSLDMRYAMRGAPTVDGRLQFLTEYCSSGATIENIAVANQFETRLRRAGRIAGISPYIYLATETWKVYHFHDTSEQAPLRGNARLVEQETLDANGGNLAAFLYYLQEAHREAFNDIVDLVRRAAPFLGSFLLRPDPRNPGVIRLRWRHVGRDELFDVSDLSDGTLRFVALMALLLQPDPPRTIILDEPELGLHPAAIELLASVMHQVAGSAQIIAATQSPTFAAWFRWDEFVIVDRVDEASEFRRLELSEVAAWMDEFSMGDIWMKNLIGGRP